MILFLDIDGVICHSKMKARNKFNWTFDPLCIEQLNRLTDAFDARIVISSSWRVFHSLPELTPFLKQLGVKADVIGATPCHPQGIRGLEILEWLGTSAEDYIVLDDDGWDIARTIPTNKFLHVLGGWYNGGLKKHHVDDFLRKKGML